MGTFWQFVVTGLLVGAIYALIALSVVLIFKATAVFNFAVGEMMMLGGMFFWSFYIMLKINIFGSLVLASLCAVTLGMAIQRIVLRPLIGQPILASVMVTLALVSVFKGLDGLIWKNMPCGFPDLFPRGGWRLGDVHISADLFLAFLISIFLIALFSFLYQRSRIGLEMRATAESHQLATAKGLSINRIFTVTWMLAGLISMICAILLGVRIGVGPEMANYGLKAFPVVILGGLDSIRGAIIAGLIIGVLEQLVGGYINPCWMEASPYALLLIFMFFRPHGLFGMERIERI